MGMLIKVLCLLIQCLLLAIGLAAAATVSESVLRVNASLVRNDTENQRVRAGTEDCIVACPVSDSINKPTFIAWEVSPGASPGSSGGGGGGSCHVYLRSADGSSERNCALMAQQSGIELANSDNPVAGLKIRFVNASHNGWYKCRVYVDSLLYVGQTELIVEDKPSAPTDLHLTPTGPNSIAAAWKPPASRGNLPLLRYELMSNSGLQLNADPTNSSLSIVELRPHTSYCFSILAVNAAGIGPKTEPICVRTGEGQPEFGALNVTLTSVSDTTVRLRATVDSDRLAGRLRLVELRCQLLWYLEAPAHRLADSRILRVDIAANKFNSSGAITQTITGLKQYSKYRLTYQVSNGVSKGPIDTIEFNTKEGLPPSPNLLLNQMSIFDSNLTATCQLHGRPNGRLTGYRLFVHQQSDGALLSERSFDPNVANLTIMNLQPYTSYLLSAAAVTGAGVGPKSSQIPALTEPGAPTAPVNLTASLLADTRGLLLSWDNRPAWFRDDNNKQFPNYLLTYRVYWTFINIGSGKEFYFDSPNTLDKLATCECAQQGESGCQPRSDRICLPITWNEVVTSSQSIAHALNRFSRPGLRVRLWIQAVGKSTYDSEGRRYFGDTSDQVELTAPTGQLLALLPYRGGGLGRSSLPGGGGGQDRGNGNDVGESTRDTVTPAVMVGMAVGGITIAVALATGLSLGWRWLCARHRGYQRPFSQGLETFECLTADNEQGGHSSHSAGSSRPKLRCYSQTEHKAMSVTEFRDHVIASHANDNSAFQLEFEEIQRLTQKDWPGFHAKHPENLSKNRYTDICPYDHSRVVLLSNSGKKLGDYINANYVDGYRRDKAYIACQGPVPSTFDDFWLMVWENRCTAIVMISNFVERGRRKCDQYWPTSGSEVYGAISVKLVRQLNKAAYCMREFSIRNLRAKKLSKERQLFHFHYSEWPDYGVPAYPLPVLNFVQRTAAYCGGDQSGPVVVHCSAGVGRTGTFICIESQIRQILCEKTVNVRGFLEHIRQQRMRLVQTEEQYIFIHDVLLEFLLCPEREISMERLPDYFSNLMEETEPCGCTGLETQYQLCVAHQPADYELASALKQCNYAKNRADVYPIESRRVKLTCEPGVEGSDYINASHVHGYQSVNEFIVTQLPMKDTLFDFYRMIWEQNCVCVVSVHPSLYSDGAREAANADEDGTDLPDMWPTNESEALTAGYLQVWFRSREDYPFGECREFLLASNKDDYSVLTSVWTLKRWPDTFGESITLIELVKAISNTRGMFTSSPIIVMDMYGGSYAGIICSLYVLYKQLMMEGTADVYSLFKMYHLQRPGMFNSKADMEFIYAVISFHAKYFSPSNSLSLRRGGGGGGGHHSHHGNGSLTTQQSHDSHEPIPGAASPPETFPLRQIPAPSAPPGQSSDAGAFTDAENDKAPVIRFANGRRRLSASRSAHGSFCVGAASVAAGESYSTHTG